MFIYIYKIFCKNKKKSSISKTTEKRGNDINHIITENF